MVVAILSFFRLLEGLGVREVDAVVGRTTLEVKGSPENLAHNKKKAKHFTTAHLQRVVNQRQQTSRPAQRPQVQIEDEQSAPTSAEKQKRSKHWICRCVYKQFFTRLSVLRCPGRAQDEREALVSSYSFAATVLPRKHNFCGQRELN